MKNYAALLLVLSFAVGACNRPREVKKLTAADRIFDSAQLLSPVQRDSIFQLIEELHSTVGSEVGVNIISSLKGQKIDPYSLAVANQLGLGRPKYNDGILLTLAMNDHQMRIEVGLGLENIIRDEIASRINRTIMAPQFRKGNFCRGIYLGIDSIKFLIERDVKWVGKPWVPQKPADSI
jgi:uncharacterized protein